jgi:hypothetical protein
MPKKIKCDEEELIEVTCVKKSKPKKKSVKKRRYKTKSAGKKKGSKSPIKTKSPGKKKKGKSRGKGGRKKSTSTSEIESMASMLSSTLLDNKQGAAEMLNELAIKIKMLSMDTEKLDEETIKDVLVNVMSSDKFNNLVQLTNNVKMALESGVDPMLMLQSAMNGSNMPLLEV